MYNHNFTSHISIFSSHEHYKQKLSIKMLLLLPNILWCLCDLLKYNTIGTIFRMKQMSIIQQHL